MKQKDDQMQQIVKVHPFINGSPVIPIKQHFLSISSLTIFISAHIQTTLDLPELDFSGALRETTSRMENMISTNRNGAAPAHSRTSSGSNSSEKGDVMQRSHTTLH